METTVREEVTVLFAGDSGDGIQLTGGQFTNTHAHFGNDVSTFPDFPAEIRAPQGSLAGVSGFKIKFGSIRIYTPGDACDVLVVMNAAALKTNISALKKGGIIIANSAGFDEKNLRLAKFEENPLETVMVEPYDLHQMDVTKMTRTALKDSGLGQKEIDRCKNMFVLGFVYWMFDRQVDGTVNFLQEKFDKLEKIRDANINVLKAGYHFGETSETFRTRYSVKPAKLPKGTYRNITGNQALGIGLVAAAEKSGLEMVYASYPITPASTLLHYLSQLKNYNVKTFQAEDEIAAICTAIGASFGGSIGVTGSSGPGVALKGEALGLAMILELPLVLANIQRGGPSTGLPTKTEQADLFQALFGRNGEAPLPVLASRSPSDCFWTAFEATRIAIEHMTPVMILSDGYIANGSEPWKFPNTKDLPEILPNVLKKAPKDTPYLPYERNDLLVRKWALPGTPGLQHRIGGLEKEDLTGNVSYDPTNHQKMTSIRRDKIENISKTTPEQEIDSGEPSGELLVLGWGSTFGAIRTAVQSAQNKGISVSHAHLRYLHPLPGNLFNILNQFEKVLIPEMNMGQLKFLIQGKFLVPVAGMSKVQGIPFTTQEIMEKIESLTK